MIRLRNRIGQSTLEYAILIAVVISALIIMQTYVKRGLQGRLRSASDDIGEQYSPGNVEGTMSTRTRRLATETMSDGETTTNITEGWTDRTGQEQLGDLASEIWPE